MGTNFANICGKVVQKKQRAQGLFECIGFLNLSHLKVYTDCPKTASMRCLKKCLAKFRCFFLFFK